MEREQRHPSPMPPAAAAAAVAASVSLVLGSHDLLAEILLRLGFPTTLVRAALACKGWLRVASDPAFLRRFRARHPPRLLGFYAAGRSGKRPEFWPFRHPPELDSAVARAASVFDAFPGRVKGIMDCRAGRLHIKFSKDGWPGQAVLSPLRYPAGESAILHPPPGPEGGYCSVLSNFAMVYQSTLFLPSHGSDGVQCFELVHDYNRADRQTILKVTVFQDGEWRTRASVTTNLLETRLISKVLHMGNKLYMASADNIVMLDMESSSFSVIEFPEKIEYMFHGGQLLKADDSGVYLMNVGWDQIRFWLYRTVEGSVGNWLLVDTVYVDKMFADLGMPIQRFKVSCVGDNAEFVLVEAGGGFFHIDIGSRTVEEVVRRESFLKAWPIMMIWPPSFPAMKEGHDQNE